MILIDLLMSTILSVVKFFVVLMFLPWIVEIMLKIVISIIKMITILIVTLTYFVFRYGGSS